MRGLDRLVRYSRFGLRQGCRVSAAAPAVALVCESLECRFTPSAAAFLELGELFPAAVTEVQSGTRYVVGSTTGAKPGTSMGLLIDVAKDTSSFSQRTLAGLGGSTTVKQISADGRYIVGTSVVGGFSGEGVVWQTGDPSQPTPIGILGNAANATSSGTDVSNDGMVVGNANGGGSAIKWTSESGLLLVNVPNGGSGSVLGVSSNGRVLVGVASTGASTPKATVWDNHGFATLDDRSAVSSAAYDVSPNGAYIAGSVVTLLANSTAAVETAAFWDAGKQFHPIHDASGQPLLGRAVAVSNNGYIVGYSADGAGWVYRIGWQSAQTFNSWLGSNYSLQLPKEATSVNGVYFDGEDTNFVVSAGATAYFVTVGERHVIGGNPTPTHIGTPGNDIIRVEVDPAGDFGGIYVDAGPGNDVVVISGTAVDPIVVNVDAGAGDDVVIVDASGPVDIIIDFGTGNDHLIDNSHSDEVGVEIVGGEDDGFPTIIGDTGVVEDGGNVVDNGVSETNHETVNDNELGQAESTGDAVSGFDSGTLGEHETVNDGEVVSVWDHTVGRPPRGVPISLDALFSM